MTCDHCGAISHRSQDCPGQFQKRMVVALERIVELLEEEAGKRSDPIARPFRAPMPETVGVVSRRPGRPSKQVTL